MQPSADTATDAPEAQAVPVRPHYARRFELEPAPQRCKIPVYEVTTLPNGTAKRSFVAFISNDSGNQADMDALAALFATAPALYAYAVERAPFDARARDLVASADGVPAQAEMLR